MIRAYDIRVAEHLSNFKCDACGEVQTDVNVNTGLNWGEASIENESVGTGDGEEVAFQLDKSEHVFVASVSASLDGVRKVQGVDYDATTEGLVTFEDPPAEGVLITASYTYYGNTALIKVPCTNGVCGQVSYYPTVGGGAISQLLAQAKTE